MVDSEKVRQELIEINALHWKQLKNLPDWLEFLKSECKQLDWYQEMKMFGKPVKRLPGMLVLPWVWNYHYKECEGGKDQTKARGTCNGSARFFKENKLGETFTAYVKQPMNQLTWALWIAHGLICKVLNVGNAFAKAPALEFKFYMKPEKQFCTWWTDHLHNPPLKYNDIIPIHHALQGHPITLRLWNKYITKLIIEETSFQNCVKEPCLYYKFSSNFEDADVLLILR